MNIFNAKTPRADEGAKNRKGAMHGVPNATAFNFLAGARIERVKHFDHSIMIHLSNGRSVHVEGGYRVDGIESIGKAMSVDDLIGSTIESVSVPTTSQLVFGLSQGKTLIMFDDSTQYECIVIDPDGIVI